MFAQHGQRNRTLDATSSRRTLAVIAAAALALAACSGSDDAAGPAPADSAPVTADAPVETAAPDASPPPATTATPPTTAAPETTAAPTTTAAPETTTTEPEPACPPPVPNEFSQPAGIVASFDRTAFEIAEGVAVDKSGNVYVSLPPLGQIVRFAPGSSEYEVVATIPGWDLAPEDYFVDHFGILGIALDADGNIYAAADSAESAGVWKFDCRTGEGARFEGTETMLFANALAFDDVGNLFVTESFSGMEGDIPLGAVWKITPDGMAEKWLENTTLGGPNIFGLAKPNGANGIAFRDGLLYVNVLQQSSIVTIEVLDDGSPGAIEPYITTEIGFINDGIALDEQGRVYVTDVLTNGVLRIDPDGTIVPIAGGEEAGFDSATSIAFGIGGTALTMYAVNLSTGSFEPTDTPGPALVAIDVDTPGMPLP
jgi:sugar lactone lactonase YvrE